MFTKKKVTRTSINYKEKNNLELRLQYKKGFFSLGITQTKKALDLISICIIQKEDYLKASKGSHRLLANLLIY